jgi:hypothetical protein
MSIITASLAYCDSRSITKGIAAANKAAIIVVITTTLLIGSMLRYFIANICPIT